MRDYTAQPVPDSVWKNPYHFVAFGFGSGAVPFAPGTFGTLMAIPFYLAMQHMSPILYLLLLIGITLGSMWLCEKVSKETNSHDHSGMCIDEIVGFLVTMFAAPQGFIWILLGFGLFRFFDIVKPWPIDYVDLNVKGGVGMILDDVLAGVYSLIILHIISWIF
jgi:phosphatidylglycerophosphatase A